MKQPNANPEEEDEMSKQLHKTLRKSIMSSQMCVCYGLLAFAYAVIALMLDSLSRTISGASASSGGGADGLALAIRERSAMWHERARLMTAKANRTGTLVIVGVLVLYAALFFLVIFSVHSNRSN